MRRDLHFFPTQRGHSKHMWKGNGWICNNKHLCHMYGNTHTHTTREEHACMHTHTHTQLGKNTHACTHTHTHTHLKFKYFQLGTLGHMNRLSIWLTGCESSLNSILSIFVHCYVPCDNHTKYIPAEIDYGSFELRFNSVMPGTFPSSR